MKSLSNDKAVKDQYGTADGLNIRISIHSKYSTNKQGFGNWIMSQYQIADGMSVLELGCGTGDMWKDQDGLIRRMGRLVLSDFSEGMLAQTRTNLAEHEGIEYQVIDIQQIPFADDSFDIVIANMMLYHVPDLQKGLSEVRRVLKQGGSFYCATYGENGIMEYIASLFDIAVADPSTEYSFTLQNGVETLSRYFDEVQCLRYEDSLAVTDIRDMAAYIASLNEMSALHEMPEEKVLSVLQDNVRDGVLTVPKEYGMFVCR